MIHQTNFSSAQIIAVNPVLQESFEARAAYYLHLKALVRQGQWLRRKYADAQLGYYKQTLCPNSASVPRCPPKSLDPAYAFLLPLDLAAVVGFRQYHLSADDVAALALYIQERFELSNASAALLRKMFDAAAGDSAAWRSILRTKCLRPFAPYLKLVQKNIRFVADEPFTVLIAANMSAGKSTLINALTGKNISRTQNMACTSKIHAIVGKPFEDGSSSEYDDDLEMDAGREELLNDNENNRSGLIVVGTYFDGALGGQRLVLLDSPGVNNSENDEHGNISRRMVAGKRYQLFLYVLNATQLGTEDEQAYLQFVAKLIGRKKILFVLNKVDELLVEEENLDTVIEHQRAFLRQQGFREPVICPVSAQAAFLARRAQQESLKRFEQREFELSCDVFTEHSLAPYYEKQLRCPHLSVGSDEDQRLLKNCGMSYLESIIKKLINGGM